MHNIQTRIKGVKEAMPWASHAEAAPARPFGQSFCFGNSHSRQKFFWIFVNFFFLLKHPSPRLDKNCLLKFWFGAEGPGDLPPKLVLRLPHPKCVSDNIQKTILYYYVTMP